MFGRICRALAWGVLAYVAGGAAGCGAITLLSSNTHDRALEAAMTGAFVVGPLAAIVAFLAVLLRRGRADGECPLPTGPREDT